MVFMEYAKNSEFGNRMSPSSARLQILPKDAHVSTPIVASRPFAVVFN
jgi:hypothetical protein